MPVIHGTRLQGRTTADKSSAPLKAAVSCEDTPNTNTPRPSPKPAAERSAHQKALPNRSQGAPWLPPRARPGNAVPTTTVTPPYQAIRQHTLDTPKTPCKARTSGRSCSAHRTADMQDDCPVHAVGTASSADPPATARALLAELEAMAAAAAVPIMSGPTQEPHAQPLEGAQLLETTLPPWRTAPCATVATDPLEAQRRLCTAKLQHMEEMVASMLCEDALVGAGGGGREEAGGSGCHAEVTVTFGMLTRVEMALRLATDVANTAGSTVWVVVLLEYRCTLLLRTAGTAVMADSACSPDVCRRLLMQCDDASWGLFTAVERATRALDESVGGPSPKALITRFGLRVLQLRLLRHAAFVTATCGVSVWTTAALYAEASSLSAELLSLLAPVSAANATETEGETAMTDRQWTVLSYALLLAVQSLLEITFWVPRDVQTRVELLHDSATLLLFRRVYCCRDPTARPDEWNEEAAPATPAETCGTQPGTVPAFMRDLLLHLTSTADPSIGASAANVIMALLHGHKDHARTGPATRERSAHAEVTCAFVYSPIGDEIDLFASTESDEEARLRLASRLLTGAE